MDPSTQRMLERARARRQKLDEQSKNAGQEIGHKRSPLQDSNKSQFVKVTTEVEVVLSSPDPVRRVNVSPTKVEVCGVKQKENVNQTYSPKENKSDTNEDIDNREQNIRSQLKRLGVLYSDSQISSPIHRTENKFAIEDDVAKSSHKSSARMARLAALADNIKQWEDDLSHPNFGLRTQNIPSSGKSSPQKLTELSNFNRKDEETVHKKILEEENKDYKTSDAKLKQSFSSQHEQRVAPKKIVWDEKVLQILDSSEETTRKAEASLKPTSNDFMQKHRSVKATAERIAVPVAEKTLENAAAPSFQSSSSPLKRINEEKIEPKPESPKLVEGKSGAGRPVGSPLKVLVCSPKTGSVLHKASLFESTSPTKKVKDPAELPVSERMALFERNKGQALIPKAAFSMPVPSKYLESNESKRNVCPSSPEKGKVPGKLNINQRALNLQFAAKCTQEKQEVNAVESNIPKKVLSCRSIFEQVPANKAGNQVLNEQAERQKDLDMLRNRWNKNKNLTSEQPDMKQTKSEEKVIPAPPPLPHENSVSPMQKSVSSLPQVTQMIPKSSPTKNLGPSMVTEYENNVKKHESPKNLRDFSDVCKVKKIRVSPPKPGKLYPCLSDIEATTTETESEVPDETELESAGDSSIVTDSDDGNTSFGREILEAAGIHNKSENQPQISKMDSSDSDSDKLSESVVLADIDGCIDEALEGYDSSSDSDEGGPTPPKRTRDYSRSPPKGRRSSKQSPNSMPSQSFRYTPGDNSKYSSPEKSPSKHIDKNIPMQVVEGDKEIPLMHSVSFYRRQQNMAVKTPVKQIVRPPEIIYEKQSESSSQNEEEAVRKKISELLDEVTKQQTVISQASQALNLCMSTVEFSGSAEQVEGERLLLLATHKRQAALHEIQRLKVEGSLKPASDVAGSSSFDKGSLLLSNIALTLKKDYVRKLSTEDTCYHFVCLLRYQEQVLATQVIAATSQNLKDNCNLVWNSPLRLVDLYSDFKVTLEVYSLQSRREILPHNVKYHIGNRKDPGKSWLTPKKHKQDSRLLMPSIHSPAGPTAVRSPEFRMAGYVVFSLREISRTHFTLNKVSYSSPLEGNIQLKMKSELSVDVSERGFLTMFEDISGFGAWHRRWFVLKGSLLAYWKYPDDEKKVPIGQIDLNSCITEQIGLVSRDICARPNTFLLETARPVELDDKDSLVVVKCKDRTIIRNLLSADTKEERLVWCSQLNKALSMIRAWGKKQEQM